MPLYQELYARVPIAIILLTEELSICDLNPAALSFFAITDLNELAGKPFTILCDYSKSYLYGITENESRRERVCLKKQENSRYYGEITWTLLSGTGIAVTFDPAAFTAPVSTVRQQPDSAQLLELIGNSPQMTEICRLCKIFHREPTINILIEGETGTGKEVFARLIHYGEEGNENPFIAVNCPAIPEALFESELFGYEKGAFTGANSSRRGKLDAARHGTLLLDEIGDLALPLQTKLLRLLQEREYFPIGSTAKCITDARFIAATNQHLRKAVQTGGFREDLYYRLEVGHLYLPPLRERQEEIERLSLFFVNLLAAEKGKKTPRITKEAMDILINHPWPGNIRELRNTIERGILFSENDTITPEELGFTEQIPITKTLFNADEFNLPEKSFSLDKLDKQIAQAALKKFNGNKTQAAEYLGLTRSALRSRL